MFRVMVYEQDLEEIADWVLEYPDRETGGDLFGFWTHSGSPAVQLTLGPGPQARHETAAFFQDVRYLSERGRALQARHGLQHIGDWHSHHGLNLAEPSGGDASTVYRTLQANGFQRFLVCIANIRVDEVGARRRVSRPEVRGPVRRQAGNDLVVTLHAYLFDRDRRGFSAGQFVVLPGESPIAASARRDRIIADPAGAGSAWHVERADHRAGQSGGTAARRVPDGWHASPWGSSFLRVFDAELRRCFPDSRLVLTGLSLTYHLTAGDEAWELSFPLDFPTSPARLRAGGADLVVDCGGDNSPRRCLAVVSELLSSVADRDGRDGSAEVPQR
ncbi:hypothetical protein F4553_002080 [Allocatelliglobosispora scoriae]|uniref:JAB domain-containing protein n=1 Tax=Allocatelliglobosispora scoriae TaxID=643052 RepID=A0A841BPE7_9ACTN|nr:Mov34/MPN/PAD-1 family protein [Allocatelliglobosispora scoriae]MBB5868701.1 hypothetical protein [Allocatelliglobosispora scoriae]